MKHKNYPKHMSHALYALMTTVLFLWCGVSTALAQGSGTKEDPYTLVVDGKYNAPGYQLFGKFTAPSDGVLSIASFNYTLYTDETFTTTLDKQPKWSGSYATNAYNVECTGGTTYYLGGSTMSSEVTISFLTEAEPLKLISCSPENGSVFDPSIGMVNLEFNQKVLIGGCLMTFGNQTHNPEVSINNAYASVDIKNILIEAYNNGSLKEGDDITVKFSGIKALEDNNMLLGEDGTFEVTYKAAPKPLMLVSTTNTPASAQPVYDFKSYYMAGDETGIVTFTFSDAVGSVKSVLLQYGSPEPNATTEESEYYEEALEPQIQGNTITLNLKGKTRRPEDMLPGVETKYPNMTLVINGVKDINGNNAYSAGQGTIGSYGYIYTYNNITYNSVADWTILDGETINSDTKNIELWLKEEGNKATFTGVKFAYKSKGNDKTVVIEAKDLAIEADPTDATAQVITIPVPDVSMDADTKVTVSLAEAETPSGVVPEEFSHEFDCTGRIVPLKITSAMLHAADGDVEMVNGTFGTIASKTNATITLNEEVGYIKWEVTEPELGSLKQSYGTPNASTFDVTFRGAAIKCLAGKTYTFTLKAWNNEAESYGGAEPTIGTATFTFTGTESEYVYSDVELINHIAEPFPLMNKEQDKYTLSFTAPANVKKAIVNLGMGMSEECKVEPNENKQEWTVTLPISVLGSYNEFDLNVFAEDMEGRAINKADKAAMGSEDNTWLSITFLCEFNKPDFTVTPASESTLESIDKITFSYDGGINVSWSGNDKIQIWNNSTRTLVKEISMGELKRPSEDYEGNSEICIFLDEPITEAGNYRVEVPAGFLILGEEFESQTSKLTTIYYEIKGQTSTEVTVTPASESTVESLDKIVFTYEPAINVNWNNSEKITVLNKSTREVIAELSGDDIKYDWDDASYMWIEFAEPITAAGVYEITVPAGFFELGENGGDFSEQMILYYEVGSAVEPGNNLEVTFDPAGGNVTEIPASIKLTVTNRSEIGPNGINPTLTDDAGNSYSVSIDLNWDWDWNCLEIKLADGAITANGTYTLTIPAGAIVGSGESDTNTEDIVVTYIIATGTGIDNIVANAGGKVDVYTVNGVNVLRNADAAAVKALGKGLYIINGKKVVIK